MSQEIETQRLSLKLAVRQFGPSLAILFVCLIGAEAVLRTDAAYESLPLPKAYYTYDVTRRVHDLERLRRSGAVDVLFVGSSIVRADFDPKLFDDALKRRGLHVTSFNAGLSAMFPPAVRLYLEHLWLDAAKPRYVLHGVREAELAGGSRKASHLRGMVDGRWVEDTPWSLLAADLIQRVRLMQYKGALRRTIERWRDGKRVHATERGEITTDHRGHRKERTSLKSNRHRHSKRLWKYRRAPAKNRYRNSLPTLEAEQKLCEEYGATFVIVNMPEHAERYSTAFGPAIWADYQIRVRAWAKSKGVLFIDVTNGDLHAFEQDRYYSDFHHMSQRGAERFTTELAEEFAKVLKKKKR